MFILIKIYITILMGSINFFNSMAHLEPKCPKCDIVIKYGVTTNFNNDKEKHICKECGTELD
jgi:hypothetical protein